MKYVVAFVKNSLFIQVSLHVRRVNSCLLLFKRIKVLKLFILCLYTSHCLQTVGLKPLLPLLEKQFVFFLSIISDMKYKKKFNEILDRNQSFFILHQFVLFSHKVQSNNNLKKKSLQ